MMGANPSNYDASLQMLTRPPIQLNEIDWRRLEFLRWVTENEDERELSQDGWTVGPSSGEIVDFLAEKAKRETTAAA